MDCQEKWHNVESYKREVGLTTKKEEPFANTYGLEAPLDWEYHG